MVMPGSSKSRRGGRGMTPEEMKLWKHVTRNDRRFKEPEEEEAAAEEAPPAPESPPLPSVPVKKAVPRAAKTLPHLALGVYDGVDAATASRVRRGQYPIDGQLDLHGMNRDEAYLALRGRLEAAYHQG